MKRSNLLKREDGFTLVEIIAVLILLGILAAVAVPKYLDLTTNAEIRALEAGIAELNGRENMIWANIKLSTAGYVDDATLVADADYDTDLGSDYTWSVAATATGGTLDFGSQSQALTRTASTTDSPGRWQ